jgi:hypothetical protein
MAGMTLERSWNRLTKNVHVNVLYPMAGQKNVHGQVYVPIGCLSVYFKFASVKIPEIGCRKSKNTC